MAAKKCSTGDNVSFNKAAPCSKKDKRVSKAASVEKSEEEDTIAIDLTNPEDLLKKMEQLDLDDDETDALLKKAYEINRELKKQLELGRKVMNQKLSSSPKRPSIGLQKRPGSNRISVDSMPGHSGMKQQSRMASATHSASRSRQQSSREGQLGRSVQNYSYHSYVSTAFFREFGVFLYNIPKTDDFVSFSLNINLHF